MIEEMNRRVMIGNCITVLSLIFVIWIPFWIYLMPSIIFVLLVYLIMFSLSFLMKKLGISVRESIRREYGKEMKDEKCEFYLLWLIFGLIFVAVSSSGLDVLLDTYLWAQVIGFFLSSVIGVKSASFLFQRPVEHEREEFVGGASGEDDDE